jgi:hypothetical protein
MGAVRRLFKYLKTSISKENEYFRGLGSFFFLTTGGRVKP